MRCGKAEKWISDALDGELGERRRGRLKVHLGKCAACRAYRKMLEKIQREYQNLEVPGIEPQDWDEFSTRLQTKLQKERPDMSSLRPPHPRWKWAWGGAICLLVILFGLVFISRRGASPESPIFSSDAFFNRFDLEIGVDPRLEEFFAVVLAESLPEEPSPGAEEARFLCSDDPFFWESLSDEELGFIEKEIAKETQS